jgi:hypothetical protein
MSSLTTLDSEGNTPFKQAAQAYWKSGWGNPIPLTGKFPPVTGYTGWEGRTVSYVDMQSWLDDDQTPPNVALRLQHGVVGIDVDAYDGKTGDASLKAAEDTLGPLPATWTSTSRGPGQPSRIHLFSVPVNTMLKGAESLFVKAFGEHVDIIHFGHRYVVAAPSVHPKTGTRYGWYDPEGNPVDGIPMRADIAPLPLPWLEFFTTQPEVSDTTPTPGTPLEDRKFTQTQAEAYCKTQMDLLRTASDGRVNNTLNDTAMLIGHFVPAFFDYDKVTEWLVDAQKRDFHDKDERGARASIKSGLTAGMKEPYVKVEETELEVASTLIPEEEIRPKSWGKMDLTEILSGDFQPVKASLMPRSDGVCLLYPGLIHSFHGESESGKSWVALAEVARLLKAGEPVLFVDNESDPVSVVGRLRDLGCSNSEIGQYLDYRRPEANPTADRPGWDDMLNQTYTLAVIDGVTDALGLFGVETKDNDGVAKWMRAFPRQLATRTGAAVIMIDHVTKSAERGRFAIGAQAKMAGLDGAAYSVEVKSGQPLAKGVRGTLVIKVAKDRPGYVRGHGGKMGRDRTQTVAEFVLDSTTDVLEAFLFAPDTDAEEGTAEGAQAQVTARMESARAIVAGILNEIGLASQADVERRAKTMPSTYMKGKFHTRDDVRTALEDLVRLGLAEVSTVTGRGGGQRFQMANRAEI